MKFFSQNLRKEEVMIKTEHKINSSPNLFPFEEEMRKYRLDFPILQEKIYGKPLVYLDNAATTQKPLKVIDAITHYYKHENANIHRGIHALSTQATHAFESARHKVQKFLNASDSKEIIFTRSATEAINLVAQSYGKTFLKEGDEVIISLMEHHSNIVPWQMLCEQIGATLRVIPIAENGELELETYEKILNKRTKIVAITQLSNALGTLTPIKKMIQKAHGYGAVVLVDGAQAVPHLKVDVQDLDCDFYCFSGHKLFGPTGIGVLYGKTDHLEVMPPYQGGGDMISSVSFEKTSYNVLPYKFEAGTPDISGVIGLGAAIDYLESIGLNKIAAYEKALLVYGTSEILKVPKLKLIGNAKEKASILSFTIQDIHPHDVGTVLDREGIAVRAGHHCAMPVMDYFQIPATTRASLAFYNTREEIDALVKALYKVEEIFG